MCCYEKCKLITHISLFIVILKKKFSKGILGRKSHSIMIRGKFWTLSNISYTAFVQKKSTAKRLPIFAKSSIIDAWLGSKYASDDTERAFPIKQKPFSVPAKKTQDLFLTMQYLQKENEKKLNWCLKNQTEETGTNTPLYFSIFQFSSVSKQVFCNHIHWCIQNPAKHLKWGLFQE